MRPSGPRVRSNDPRQQRQPVSSSASPSSASRHPPARSGPPADRDQVFASIFGRSAGGHHTAANSAHSSPGPQGYGYSQNLPPAHAYPQQQFVGANHDPYAHPARQPMPNVGYEAFAPPLPPPTSSAPSPNGPYGQIPPSLAGPRERPMMRAGTDFHRDPQHNNYRYEVGSTMHDMLR